MNSQALENAEFERPIDVILWASRTYLQCTAREQPVPAVLPRTFDEAQLGYLYAALVRMLKRLVASTTVALTVHAPNCPSTSFHEQALITALRSLQHGSAQGYRVALAAVLPPTAVRLSLTDMSIIASALSDIERFWPTSNPVDALPADAKATIPYPASVH